MRTRAPQPQRVRGLDRLPTLDLLVGIGLACVGCPDSGSSGKSKPASSRVAAVEATPTADPEEVAKQWCDVFVAPQEARSFSYPSLARGEGGGNEASPRWVNVWATWCKPCIEELPRVEEFHGRLAKDGVRVDLELVAADEAEAVDAFATEHPAAGDTKILAEPDGAEAWLKGLGMSSGALPAHLFVDGQQRLRCARMGGVGDNDYESVQAVLRTL